MINGCLTSDDNRLAQKSTVFLNIAMLNTVSRSAMGELVLSCLGAAMPPVPWTAMLQQSQGREKGNLVVVLEFRTLIYTQERQVSLPWILLVFFHLLFYPFTFLKSGTASTHGRLSWILGNSQDGQWDSLDNWVASIDCWIPDRVCFHKWNRRELSLVYLRSGEQNLSASSGRNPIYYDSFT